MTRAATKYFIGIFFFLASISAGFANCEMPKNPIIPDGKKATKEEMVKAIKFIKTDYQMYISAFQNCIQNEQATVGEYATQEQKNKWTTLFNHAFDLQSFFVSKLNKEIRVLKKPKKRKIFLKKKPQPLKNPFPKKTLKY